MSAVLDTCIVSELRKANPEPRVVAEIQSLAEQPYISVITIGEILRGAQRAKGRRQRDLLDWLRRVEQRFALRTLNIDTAVARRWGQITADARGRGIQIPVADGLIAATALHRGLPVMTRNVSDFGPTGVEVIDPWSQ